MLVGNDINNSCHKTHILHYLGSIFYWSSDLWMFLHHTKGIGLYLVQWCNIGDSELIAHFIHVPTFEISTRHLLLFILRHYIKIKLASSSFHSYLVRYWICKKCSPVRITQQDYITTLFNDVGTWSKITNGFIVVNSTYRLLGM